MRKYSIILSLLVTVLSGCDDFLSQVPDNRAQLDSKEKIAELLVTAYPEANYMMFCEAMSDNVEDNPNAFQDVRNADAFFWRDASFTNQDSPDYYWNACYAAIAAANHALRAIENADDPTELDAQKGEALVARAYAHFMLVSLFSKMYDPKTSATDPGIPYVTEPETVALKEYERNTVDYVYSMIEDDLIQGLSLIDDKAYVGDDQETTGVMDYHFNKAASHTFAVRFYLFKRDYNKVIEHANQVFSSGDIASILRPWNSTYRNYSANELMNVYTNSSEKANLLLCETASEWARSFNALRYDMGAQKYQEIFGANPSTGRYAFSAFYSSTGVYFINKFKEHFVRIGTNANTGYPYTILPLFTTEEALLSRAEAYAMLNRFHEALADINLWASTRIADYDPELHAITFNRIYEYYQENINQLALLAAILDCRRVEFIHEGLRWFDILRHKIPVVHTTSEGEELELGPDDPRRVLQIPGEAISLGGLAPNPR